MGFRHLAGIRIGAMHLPWQYRLAELGTADLFSFDAFKDFLMKGWQIDLHSQTIRRSWNVENNLQANR